MRKSVAIVLAVVLIAGAAVAGVVYGPRTVRTIALHRAEDRWDDAAVADYTWRLDTECFGACTNGAPVVISVRGETDARVAGRRNGSIRIPTTVDQLFRWVERAVGADGYSVSFDPERGFPTGGRFDPSRNTQDDEWGFTVMGLQPDEGASTEP